MNAVTCTESSVLDAPSAPDAEIVTALNADFEVQLHEDYARMVELDGPVSWPCPCTACDMSRNAQSHARAWIKRVDGMITDYLRRW